MLHNNQTCTATKSGLTHERGEHNLAIMNFLKIADALGIKASSLLHETKLIIDYK